MEITTLVLVITLFIGQTALFLYVIRRAYNIIHRQSTYIMADKNEVAYHNVAEEAHKRAVQKLDDTGALHSNLRDSIVMDGVITDKQMEELEMESVTG